MVPNAYPAPRGRIGRAQVAVLTVIEEEFDAVSEALGICANIPGTPYFVRSAADGPDWDVVLSQCPDRSNVPFRGEAGEVIEDFRPQVLLLVGIAGGICDENGVGRDGISPGDVLIAEYVDYVDFLKITDEGTFVRHYAIDYPSLHLRRVISIPLRKTFNLAAAVAKTPPQATSPKIHIGAIASGEKVMGGVDNRMQQQLLKPFDKALAIDMESIGIARAVCERRTSFWYNPRYAIIRGISDLVGPAGNDEMRAGWKPFAAHTAAVVAREFIQRLSAEFAATAPSPSDQRQSIAHYAKFTLEALWRTLLKGRNPRR